MFKSGTDDLEERLQNKEVLGVDEIEHILKTGLLEENYQGLTRWSGRVCAELVVDYITLTNTVLGKDVFFVKKLTKVASHINKGSTKMKCLMQRVYQFNIEGANMSREIREDPEKLEVLMNQFLKEEKLRTKLLPGDREETVKMKNMNKVSSRLVVLESHFLSHAGKAMSHEYKRTKNIKDAVIGYEHLVKAGLMLRRSDPLYSVGSFIEAAEMIKDAAKKETDYLLAIYLGEKRYHAYHLASELVQESDSESFFKIHANTADAAEWLFVKTGEFKWGERWFKTYFDSAKKAERFKSAWTSYHYAIAAKAAKRLALIDNKEFWDEQHTYCMQKHLDTYKHNQRIPKRLYDRIKHK